MSDVAIQAEGLAKRFGEVRALDGIDLAVRPGTVFGLLGPNGAGKTTAIRILSTLLRPDGGRAMVGGFDVVHQPGEVRRLIGLTGQYAAVDELLSGEENLYMIGRLIGMGRADARRRSAELLRSFDLVEAGEKIVKTYSGGMRRRLDLAASLVGRPRFLYLDEPTTGLDPRSRLELWDMIRDLVSDGTTVLLTTQYLDEADRLADEIVVIDHGRVIAEGTTDQLKARVGQQVIEVHPAEPSQIPLAAQVLQEFCGPDESLHSDDQMVSVKISDPGVLAKAVLRLEEAGVQVEDLALRRPSLDEAFLALTGHVAEPTSDEENLERSRT
ncbi:MAG TPA: ATP-binding cassette domain-containing protein [Actinomycetota bacterium]|nr:ATP-binding cassette domain-containing protein [Actinomycetota bacterium]